MESKYSAIMYICIKKPNNNFMKNPRILQVGMIGAQQVTYTVPTYIVTNDGIIDGEGMEIKMCKGNKEDGSVFRQEGVFTESLIEAAKTHLESVNKGELATRETAIAITKLEEALMWIKKRADDRALRGVQGTYQK